MREGLPIEVNPEIMSGAPVFAGTRVPVETLFNYLMDGVSLDEFFEWFPTVKRSDVTQLLEYFKEETLRKAAG